MQAFKVSYKSLLIQEPLGRCGKEGNRECPEVDQEEQ